MSKAIILTVAIALATVGAAHAADVPTKKRWSGFDYQNQNNFNASACTGSGAFISSNRCGGSQDGLSFPIDWTPVKRVDLYAGVMISNVYAGVANGDQAT